jgi:hypothetical protein
MECTEIFESHKSDKGLTSKMYKEPLKFNHSNDRTVQLKNKPSTLIGISLKEINKWLIETYKIHAALLILRETQIKTTMSYHLTLIRMTNMRKMLVRV